MSDSGHDNAYFESAANAASFAKETVDQAYDNIKDVISDFLQITDSESSQEKVKLVCDRFASLNNHIHCNVSGTLSRFENDFDGTDADYVVEKYKELVADEAKILDHYFEYKDLEGIFYLGDDNDDFFWEDKVLKSAEELRYLGIACARLMPSQETLLRETFNTLDGIEWGEGYDLDEAEPEISRYSASGMGDM